MGIINESDAKGASDAIHAVQHAYRFGFASNYGLFLQSYSKYRGERLGKERASVRTKWLLSLHEGIIRLSNIIKRSERAMDILWEYGGFHQWVNQRALLAWEKAVNNAAAAPPDRFDELGDAQFRPVVNKWPGACAALDALLVNIHCLTEASIAQDSHAAARPSGDEVAPAAQQPGSADAKADKMMPHFVDDCAFWKQYAGYAMYVGDAPFHNSKIDPKLWEELGEFHDTTKRLMDRIKRHCRGLDLEPELLWECYRAAAAWSGKGGASVLPTQAEMEPIFRKALKLLVDAVRADDGKPDPGDGPDGQQQAAPKPTDPRIVQADAGPAGNKPPLVLQPDDVKILRTLKKSKTTKTQYALEQDTHLSRRNISQRLAKMREAGLTHRPNGEHGGEAITDAGRAKIAH